jgi:hypothetical protein
MLLLSQEEGQVLQDTALHPVRALRFVCPLPIHNGELHLILCPCVLPSDIPCTYNDAKLKPGMRTGAIESLTQRVG